MSTKNNPIEDPEVKIETAIDRAESYLEKNFKTLLIGVGLIIVVTGGYFGYNSFISAPKLEKASAAAYVAEQNFQVDSFALALNGNDNFDGFLTIASDYSSTSVGNIANHYAGICYLKLGDKVNAITYLKKYSAVEGVAAQIINAQNLGLIGDITLENGDAKSAVALYEKAAKIENDFTAPMFLKKAGLVYSELGDKEAALEAFTTIQNLYPTALEARDIDKFIGRIEK